MSVRPHTKQREDPAYADAWIVDYRGADGKRKQIVINGTRSEAVVAGTACLLCKSMMMKRGSFCITL